MATAKKLKSGNYRCRAFIGTDENGKKLTKSFTAPTKKEAEYLASEYLLNMKSTPVASGRLIFKDATTKFINNRSSVLSPSTIKGYHALAKNYLADIDNIPVDEITQEDIQKLINNLCSKDLKPKTVRNVHGLISSVLLDHRPNFKLNTALPAKQKPNLYIPSDDEVIRIINWIRKIDDKNLLIAVLLAAYGPMRRSEICAVTSNDVNGGTVHVNKAMVKDYDNKWVIKNTPKTAAGDRYIVFPDFVIKEIKGREGRILNIYPDYISDHFERALKHAKVPHIRFHDLRHYSASIQHAMGIPDAYIMERGGWESDATLKQIYRHALDDQAKLNNDKINDYFTKLQKAPG